MTPSPPPPDELHALRAEMDTLNHRLVVVLHERARLARRIGRLKQRTGAAAADAAREQAMLDAALATTPPDGFPAAAIGTILGAVFAASRALVSDPEA